VANFFFTQFTFNSCLSVLSLESMHPRDLRLKLQGRISQPGFAGTKRSGVRDLREKLSGMMHQQPSNADPPKPKPVSEVVKIMRRENAVEVPVRQSKKTLKQTSSKKVSHPKVCNSHVMNFIMYMFSHLFLPSIFHLYFGSSSFVAFFVSFFFLLAPFLPFFVFQFLLPFFVFQFFLSPFSPFFCLFSPPLLFHPCFVSVFRLMWVSSLVHLNLLGTKRLGCCCIFQLCIEQYDCGAISFCFMYPSLYG
jgi:hypothetical protein